MKFDELDQITKKEILALAEKFPFSTEEIIPYYLAGGRFTEKLLKLKLTGATDIAIRLYNDGLWNTEVDRLSKTWAGAK